MVDAVGISSSGRADGREVSMSLSADLADRLTSELQAHVTLGREVAAAVGEDSRPPLVAVERWRFTAQALARRGLVDGHPALVAFEDHCYSGMLNQRRLARGIDLFEAAVDAVSNGGLACRIGVTRELLYSIVLASEEVPASAFEGALWAAAALLATVAGVRGAGEHPARPLLTRRLADAGIVDEPLAAQMVSPVPHHIRNAAEMLLARL